MTERLIVIGGAGNVGRGVVNAFNRNEWEVEVVDPVENKTFEDLDSGDLRRIFSSVKTVVYCADSGNREDYVDSPDLSEGNNKRFAEFCNKVSKINPDATVWYVGGSWTKRKPDGRWKVNDGSPNKPLSECNDYEKAKISAEDNAQELSSKVRIRFLDWASIVPNMADNFSIPQMVIQAIENGRIKYSPGQYGRPLLESTQAGEVLAVLVENDDNIRFKKYLIPGAFIPFSVFAETVKRVVEKEAAREIDLEEIPETPDFLKTKTNSGYLSRLGFRPDKGRVLAALEKNAREYLKKTTS